MRKVVVTFIAAERWWESADIYAFSYSSLIPTSFLREDLAVFRLEMKLGIWCMLHDAARWGMEKHSEFLAKAACADSPT